MDQVASVPTVTSWLAKDAHGRSIVDERTFDEAVLASECGEVDLDDPRFKLFFKPVGHWGGPNDAQFDVLKTSSPDFEAAMRAIRDRLRGMSNPVLETGSETADLPEICYASRANSLGIRADGRIAKCTVALNDPRNAIGRILPDGRLEIDREKLAPWMRGFDDFDLATLGCPLAGLPALAGAQRRAEAAE